jgi:sugar phosphate isomerase/epimerase
MKLGFLTVCLGDMSLKEKAEWAGDNGFRALEVACWPKSNSRDYSACDIDVATLDKNEADDIKKYMKENGLSISSLAYYDNNIDADPKKRAAVNGHLTKVIDAAVMLDVLYVGTFVGRNIGKRIKDCFDDYEEVFGKLTAYAEKKGIKLMIENCDMRGWQKPGEPGTISYSPELWDEMFRRIPDKNFGLNYDPSHLVLMLMDHLSPVKTYKDRIFHVHAKDAKIFKDKLNRYGILDKQLGGVGEWGYKEARMPGLGDIDWRKFLKTLKDIGYDHVISIEHEDNRYTGSLDKIKEGLLLARDNLLKCGPDIF